MASKPADPYHCNTCKDTGIAMMKRGAGTCMCGGAHRLLNSHSNLLKRS